MQNTITFNNLSAVQLAAIGYVLTMPDDLLIGILKDPAAYAPTLPKTEAPVVEVPAPATEAPVPAPTGKKRTAAKPAAAPADAEAAPAPEVAPPAEVVQEAPAAQEPEADATVYTLEQVRAALAGLSKAGKAPVAKQLIAAAGADKLTDVDPSKYAQIMAAVAQEVA